ncbi:MAG: hypothetical protein ACHQAY_17385 [Hyphomicrobiales bacterium]
MRSTAIAIALLMTFAAPGWSAPADVSLEELRRTFTLDGKPIPPEVFADFGDSDLADSSNSIRVTIDLLAAMGSNLYADDIALGPNGWVSQKKVTGGAEKLTEETSYKFIGATHNGLLVLIASFSGGGSGDFFTLHVLDAVAAHAFDSDGELYDRLNLTVIRNMPLGDRWTGGVAITGDTVTIATDPGAPGGGNGRPATQRVEAVRPN